MRLPPGLCPAPRRGCLHRPQNPSGDTLSHTLAKGPTELRAPGPRDPTIRHCTTHLRLMYMDMVMILKRHIHAERIGLWKEHLAEVEKMLL